MEKQVAEDGPRKRPTTRSQTLAERKRQAERVLDPLSLLPPELVLRVLSLLGPADLASLWAVSRGWRRFVVAAESLWRRVRLDLAGQSDDLADDADLLRVLRRAPCLGAVALKPDLPAKVKQALLRVKVRKVSQLDCAADSAFGEQLLRRLGPHLEELQLQDAWLEHVKAVGALAGLRKLDMVLSLMVPLHLGRVPALPLQLTELRLLGGARLQHMKMIEGMTALRRLSVECYEVWNRAPPLPPQLEELEVAFVSTDQLLSIQRMPRLRSLTLDEYRGAEDVVFPPLPPGHCGLRTLRLWLASRYEATLLSLLRAHAATLEELALCCDSHRADADGGGTGVGVGLPGFGDDLFYFPSLAAKLKSCGLSALKELTLVRVGSVRDDPVLVPLWSMLLGQLLGQPVESDWHTDDSCLQQRRELRDALPAGVKVSCTVCGPLLPAQ